MKPVHLLWLLGLSIVGSGCALIEDANRNLCVVLKAPLETHREKARNERWAENTWQQICAKDGPDAHSADFAQGFKDGYAEYLFRGGDGEPPLVAPLHYRDIRYQNPAGYRAIQDWFDGYRFGTITARDSGARQWITGPSSLRPEFHEVPPPEESTVKPTPALLETEPVIVLPVPAAPKEPSEPTPVQAKAAFPAAPKEPSEPTPVQAKAAPPAAPSEPRPRVETPVEEPLDTTKVRITNVNVPSSRPAEPDQVNVPRTPDTPHARIKAVVLPRPE